MPPHVPRLIYGTAWKQDRTRELVVKAVSMGFRALDTACQPVHYNERGVGDALQDLASKHGIPRQDLFVQTKFTPLQPKDSCPFDPTMPWPKQVDASLKCSRANLQTDYVDSLLLHAPIKPVSEMVLVWRSMERALDQGQTKQLGVSNVYDMETLRGLYGAARHKPKVLQNRFHADSNFDREARQFCLTNGIEYQSFWTLTANPLLLQSGNVQRIASELGRTPAQVVFRFCTQEGISPLTGTQQDVHMQQDLDIFQFELSSVHMRQINQMLDFFSVKVPEDEEEKKE